VLYSEDQKNLGNILLALYQVWGAMCAVSAIYASQEMMRINIEIGAQERAYLCVHYSEEGFSVRVKCGEFYLDLGSLMPLPKRMEHSMDYYLACFQAAQTFLDGKWR